MTKAILALIAVGVLTAACTVRSERTVVEKPASPHAVDRRRRDRSAAAVDRLRAGPLTAV